MVEFSNIGPWIASHRIACIITLERAGQFGSRSSTSVARSLADRGLRMLRLFRTDSSGPLFGRIKNATSCLGYSLGGAACTFLYNTARASDYIVFIGLFHPLSAGASSARSVDVPVLLGGSTRDTVIRTSRTLRDVSS